MKTIAATMNWQSFAQKALNGECLTVDEGLAVLEADNDELLPLMQAAFQGEKTFLRKKSEAEHDHQRQKRPLSRGLRLLLAIHRIDGAGKEIHPAG